MKYSVKFIDNFNMLKDLNNIRTRISNEFEPTQELDKYLLLIDKYGEEKVKQAYLQLSEKDKDILSLYYGIDCESVSEKKIELSSIGVSDQVNRILEQLEIYINYKQEAIQDNFYKYEDKGIEFYKNFDGYTKGEIDLVLDSLDNTTKEIIKRNYGLGVEVETQEIIAQKYNISESDVVLFISSTIDIIKKILNSNNEKKIYFSNRRNRFDELISKYGEDVVKETIEEFSKVEKDFLKLYYQLGRKKVYGIDEICKRLGVDEEKLIAIETKVLKVLKSQLDDKLRNSHISKMQKRFLRFFPDKEKLKDSMRILDKIELNLIVLYFGLNGKEIFTVEQIHEKYGLDIDYIKDTIKNCVDKMIRYSKNNR